MNEIIFFAQIFAVIAFALGALRLGKEALTAGAALQAVLANLLVLKQIDLFSLTVTCSDVFAIGCMASLNLLQEYFGKEASKRALWICFFSMFFFMMMSQIHLLYIPSALDTSQNAFMTLFSTTPRILFASLLVFFITQQIDLRFFSLLKNISLGFRSVLSLVSSQFLDTLFFTFIGLYGIIAHPWDVVFFSFAIKLLIIFSITPFVAWTKRWHLVTK